MDVFGRNIVRAGLAVLTGLGALTGCASGGSGIVRHPSGAGPQCERVVHADVVALEQAVVLNRLGAFNPAGMLYALRRDVEFSGRVQRADGTYIEEGALVDDDNVVDAAGHVRLRPDKRPRPLVLRANEGDCLQVRFHNLMMRGKSDEISGSPEQYAGKVPRHLADVVSQSYAPASGQDPGPGRKLVNMEGVSNDRPYTRAASFHVNGLSLMPVPDDQCPQSSAERIWLCGTDGGNVGLNRSRLKGPVALRDKYEPQGGQVYPGQSAVYRMYALREGTYFTYSTGAMVGGEGAGGQIGAGLFAAVNVQPKGARWYRSQVTAADLRNAAPHGSTTTDAAAYASLNYEARYAEDDPKAYRRGEYILKMLDERDSRNEIVHSDLNAIVVLTGESADRGDTTGSGRPCADYAYGNSCGHAYREFTVIMHDEVKAVQAFAELEDPSDPLHYIRDNMGINYGVAGMGAMVVARNRRTGPARDCPECRAEEFFLSSWANGDPALVLRWDKEGEKPIGAMYPDDPSNVHHSYLNDPVRFRNIHAGPKETHVFHLHAHQWVQDASKPGSTYLDSQTISPGATFSYEIEFGGSGNHNLAPGDSIFHCHLYPHFAQGMWELWRVHDVFEDGSEGRRLPDAEVTAGIENPALVPLPGSALPPMPTPEFAGYPFYIPGEPGHRPPQPPLDLDVVDGQVVDGGLPRHVLTGWEGKGNRVLRALGNQHVLEAALAKGGKAAQVNARRVFEQNPDALYRLAEEWESLAGVKFLPQDGTEQERRAMQFHAGTLATASLQPQQSAQDDRNPLWQMENAGYATLRVATVEGQPASTGPEVFRVNGRAPVPGAPFADPCPASAHVRDYKVGVFQTELTVNRHGWFDPQARILALEDDIQNIIDPNSRTHLPEPLFFRANSGDCIDFRHSNFVPNALALDDFQIYTPTDTIGQHIHLVKFDVTSSDGSGNGWNYEDGTFSPEEVRERVFAYNHAIDNKELPLGTKKLQLKSHPLFRRNCAQGDANCRAFKAHLECPAGAETLSLEELASEHPFCGAQRTVQRWYADPILDPKNGRDYTLRTVFTHDHFGPSSHQQHGLYAALIVEPSNSVWLSMDANTLDWDKLCSADAGERNDERKKILGGANLSGSYVDPNAQCSAREPDRRVVGRNELREPLKLRADGGPTSTRANIVSPNCLFGTAPAPESWGSRKDSNPLDPNATPEKLDCAGRWRAPDTRREYALALADFSILYNTALEPINPEERDESQIRRGHRQVAINLPRPLAISSEDPGTQLINYRNEPVPLRIVDFPVKGDADLGGFNYSQQRCKDTDDPGKCTGDMANVFSTLAHKSRDTAIATTPYGAIVSPRTRQLLSSTPVAGQLDDVLASVEDWRRDFNCALYGRQLPGLGCDIANDLPWRELGDPATPIIAGYEAEPLYLRLVQGAQEAQHVFAMTGQKWRHEPDNPESGYVNAQPLGISEHFEMDVRSIPNNVPRADSLYAGSSVDQLWDGMWGLVRTYGYDRGETRVVEVDGEQDQITTFVPHQQPGLARLPGMAAAPRSTDGNVSEQVCPVGIGVRHVYFDVSVALACQLRGDCSSPVRGIPYNSRIGMDDPNGIVFVRNNHSPGAEESSGFVGGDDDDILQRLKRDYEQGIRRIEPMILRAAAGDCIHVQVRNHLPREIMEGPEGDADSDSRYSDNFMSMILDGFNYNQLRMSTTVGLMAPKIASLPLVGDGANIGINQLAFDALGNDSTATADASAAALPASRPGGAGPGRPPRTGQGSLVAACGPGTEQCISRKMTWYAGDYRLNQDGTQDPAPIEFGALPLMSFGDVVKHTAHGAIGALVIGPEGSRVCRAAVTEELDADSSTYASATVCDGDGNRLYRDFVLVLQDAVDAKIKGDRAPNLAGAEEPDDYGIKAVNYRTEPLWARRGGDPSVPFEERNELDYANVFSTKASADGSCQADVSKLALEQSTAGAGGQPEDSACRAETPVFVTKAGSEVRLRIVHPGGHTRQQAISLDGHDWNPYPFTDDSARITKNYGEATDHAWIIQGNYNGIGPWMAANLLVRAGGRASLAQDYLWRSQASFLLDGGIWGLIRVLP